MEIPVSQAPKHDEGAYRQTKQYPAYVQLEDLVYREAFSTIFRDRRM